MRAAGDEFDLKPLQGVERDESRERTGWKGILYGLLAENGLANSVHKITHAYKRA